MRYWIENEHCPAGFNGFRLLLEWYDKAKRDCGDGTGGGGGGGTFETRMG